MKKVKKREIEASKKFKAQGKIQTRLQYYEFLLLKHLSTNAPKILNASWIYLAEVPGLPD